MLSLRVSSWMAIPDIALPDAATRGWRRGAALDRIADMQSPWANQSAKQHKTTGWDIATGGSVVAWLAAMAVGVSSLLEGHGTLLSALASQSGALIVAATGWLITLNLISLSERRNLVTLETMVHEHAGLLAEEVSQASELIDTIEADIPTDEGLKAAIERRRGR